MQWIASDEGVLFRSLPESAARDALYRPYRFASDRGDIAMVFRDHGLSDLLGFTYQKVEPRAAVADLFGHLAEIGKRGKSPLVSIILDGENPWEHYPNGGEDFLERLYEALDQRERDIEPVLLSARLARTPPTETLPRLHSGSWIESSFRIWIGHQEDRAAWEALGAVRKLWEEARNRGADAAALARAYDDILIAEGSDWFWWFGDDFVTDSAAEFDALFRDRLRAACRHIGAEPPLSLRLPISRQARQEVAGDGGSPPEALLRPTIDGHTPLYGEWSGAGSLLASPSRSAMYQATPPFTALYYGFDLDHLYLRLDPADSAIGADQIEIELAAHRGVQRIRFPLERKGLMRGKTGPAGSAVGSGVFLDILEVQLGFGELGVRAGDHLWLSVRALAGEVEMQRFPSNGTLELEVPGQEFDRVHWKV